MKNLIFALLTENVCDLDRYKTIKVYNKGKKITLDTSIFKKRFCCECHKIKTTEQICIDYIIKHYVPTKKRELSRRVFRADLNAFLKKLHLRLDKKTWMRILKYTNSECKQYHKIKLKRI